MVGTQLYMYIHATKIWSSLKLEYFAIVPVSLQTCEVLNSLLRGEFLVKFAGARTTGLALTFPSHTAVGQGTPSGGAAPHSPSNANSTLSRPMASTGGTRYEDRTIRRHREVC